MQQQLVAMTENICGQIGVYVSVTAHTDERHLPGCEHMPGVTGGT